MVIGIFGESCTGKSTLADKLKENIHAQVHVISGNTSVDDVCRKIAAIKMKTSVSFYGA